MNMEFKTFVFYFLSAILVFAGLRVITAQPGTCGAAPGVRLLSPLAASGCCCRPSSWPSHHPGPMSGAVMVLFLFVVMMLDINIDRSARRFLAVTCRWGAHRS